LLSRNGNSFSVRNTNMKPGKRAIPPLGYLKQIIRHYFSDEEWKAFHADHEITENKTEHMHQHILNKIAEIEAYRTERKMKVVRISKYLAAASILLLVGLGTWLVYRSDNQMLNKQNTQSTQNVVPNPSADTQPWQIVRNDADYSKRVTLPDSSIATVFPKSEIKFERVFKGQLRTVYLIGKAKFQVRKNPRRPFSVYAGGLKTTALGTSFTINMQEGKHHVSVKLHTGKIKVTQVNTRQAPVYISAIGTTLMYDAAKQMTAIIKLNKTTPKPAAFLERKGNLITMKNIPLKQVISLLNEAYGLQINANEKEIRQITYTGQVDVGKEDAQQVLSDICLINNMTLIKISDEEYSIQKTNK